MSNEASNGDATDVPEIREPEIPTPPTHEMRVSAIQVVVRVDVLEDGKKVSEGMFGPRGEGQENAPFVFYNVDQLRDFADQLSLNLELAQG
jgi:hypothetical protein